MTIMGEPYFDSRSPSKQYESPELIKSNISVIYLTPKTHGSPTGGVGHSDTKQAAHQESRVATTTPKHGSVK